MDNSDYLVTFVFEDGEVTRKVFEAPNVVIALKMAGKWVDERFDGECFGIAAEPIDTPVFHL